MKAGRLIGIIIIFLGTLAMISLFTIFSDSEYVPKIVLSGPALIIVGIAMSIFPGGNITVQELNTKEKTKGYIWTDAPVTHKVAWLIAFAMGVTASLIQMNMTGFL